MKYLRSSLLYTALLEQKHGIKKPTLRYSLASFARLPCMAHCWALLYGKLCNYSSSTFSRDDIFYICYLLKLSLFFFFQCPVTTKIWLILQVSAMDNTFIIDAFESEQVLILSHLPYVLCTISRSKLFSVSSRISIAHSKNSSLGHAIVEEQLLTAAAAALSPNLGTRYL